MSIIGNLLLNDIINNSEASSPRPVVDDSHQAVVHTLRYKISMSNCIDGMDMALLQVN